MANDEAKRVILARKARFVAASLTGMAGIAALANACAPCLDVAGPDPTPVDARRDAAKDADPQPCLSPPLRDASVEDGSDDGGDGDDAGDASDGGG